MLKARAVVVALVLGLLLSAPAAEASFHLNKVNEVMLRSGAGDASVQFVELFDGGGPTETFPSVEGPYKLVVYDASGTPVGSHTLSATGLSAARAAGRPYLVSTAAADSALGVTGDEPLDVALPAAAGQACYIATASGAAYSCITWGCIAHAVDAGAGTGSAAGPVPPPGKSVQRQPSDTVEVAAPTPKAANATGSSAPACAGGGAPTGGGGGQTPSGGGQTPSQGGPQQGFQGATLKARRVKLTRDGRLPIVVSCPAGSGGCSGRLTVKLPKARPVAVSFTVAAGRTVRLKVRLPRAALKRLGRRSHVDARWSITARDGSGQSTPTSGSLRLLTDRRKH